MGHVPRPTIGLMMLGVAVVAIWLGMATHHPGASILLLFIAIHVGTWSITRSPANRPMSPREARRFRFTTRQIVVVSLGVAVIYAISKAFPERLVGGPLLAIGKAYFLLVLGMIVWSLFLSICESLTGIFRLVLKSGGRG